MANQGRAPLDQWEELRNALTSIRPVTPSFEGLDHEDPEDYLRKCEAFFTRARIDEDQKVPTLQQALRGEARKWWAPFEFLDLPFEEFQRLVRARWNDTGEKGRLLAKLYGNQQKPNESTTVFIQQKLQLFKRLMPEEVMTQKISVIIGLIRPGLRRTLRAHNITTLPDLITRAMEAEKDEEEETQASKAVTTNTAKQPSRSNLPRCWHCEGRHYNKDCPQAPKTRPKSGNEGQAGAEAPTSANPTSGAPQ
ncbi:unnamed protein product [Trichogramma brassicae]|uniref:Retrotransposon gag domain-containing protein n=2 Tax=Trichogramma brassicae TaxID=86971 RepID=A0A6H5IDI4_9HYME|nr:unnamed protein product [Trichogramma brassicae]